jgi:hypothetical protein
MEREDDLLNMERVVDKSYYIDKSDEEVGLKASERDLRLIRELLLINFDLAWAHGELVVVV